jgi:cytochrome c biogenesis protein CcmG, thiol:disulfide interchange protein DsbE
MNWPKLVVEYGQAVAWIAIFLSVLLISFLATRRKLSLARRLSAWTGCLVAVFVVYESVGFLRWATAKVNPLKPVFREANKNAPEFAFKLVADESPRTLADYRGKVIVLNLWATWCSPCREEMPMLARLQESYGKDGVVVITVSDESAEQQAKFKDFAHMPFVKGRIDLGTRIAGLYIQPDVARPVTHIIDRNGILRETRIAGQSYESFERSIKPYL